MTNGKSTRRRSRKFAVTPKNIAKLVLVVDGVRRVVTSDYTTVMWYLNNKPTQLLGAAWKDKQFTSKLVQPAGGLAEILIAPKALDKAVGFANRGTPLAGRAANIKLATI